MHEKSYDQYICDGYYYMNVHIIKSICLQWHRNGTIWYSKYIGYTWKSSMQSSTKALLCILGSWWCKPKCTYMYHNLIFCSL